MIIYLQNIRILSSSLTWLSLYNCEFITSDEKLLEILPKLQSLIHLDLSRKPVSENANPNENLARMVSGKVLDVLAKLPKLLSLDISGKFPTWNYLSFTCFDELSIHCISLEFLFFVGYSFLVMECIIVSMFLLLHFNCQLIYRSFTILLNFITFCIFYYVYNNIYKFIFNSLLGSVCLTEDHLAPFLQRPEPLKFLGLASTGLSFHRNLPAEKVTNTSPLDCVFGLTSLFISK